MLRIINSRSQTLQLSAGTTIPVERNNPLFNDADKILQDVVYSAKAPITPANKAFHKGGHRVESVNDVYEFPVEVYDNGVFFFRGTYSYKMSSGSYDFKIQVNLGEVAAKIKSTMLTDIRTSDADYTMGGVAFEARMLDTLNNPDRYPYAFFPVKNETLGSKIANPAAVLEYVNYFDFAAQKSLGRPTQTVDGTFRILVAAPWYKLSYILKQVFAFMGVQATGPWFDSQDAKQLYIYTRRSVQVGGGGAYDPNSQLWPSMMYMPYMSVADFLKQIRQRLHISFAFDMTHGICRVHSLDTIKAAAPFNISPFLESVKEISLNTTTGYSITLKPDEQDEMWNSGTGNESKFTAKKVLNVGDAGTKEELDATTLIGIEESGRKIVATKQLFIAGVVQSNNYDDFPSEIDYNEGSRNQWPLRLVRYTGMQLKGDGKYFPETEPAEVSEQDASWYIFQNDSKNLVIRANIPPLVLSQIAVDEKICFETPEGAHVEALCKRIAYDQGEARQLIPVEIQAQTLKYDVRTSYTITGTGIDETKAPDGSLFRVMACFDSERDGLQNGLTVVCTVETKLYDDLGNFIGDHVFDARPTTLDVPADEFGVGGTSKWIEIDPDEQLGEEPFVTVKIWKGRPQYMEQLGRKYGFTFNLGGYYETASIRLYDIWSQSSSVPWMIVY